MVGKDFEGDGLIVDSITLIRGVGATMAIANEVFCIEVGRTPLGAHNTDNQMRQTEQNSHSKGVRLHPLFRWGLGK